MELFVAAVAASVVTRSEESDKWRSTIVRGTGLRHSGSRKKLSRKTDSCYHNTWLCIFVLLSYNIISLTFPRCCGKSSSPLIMLDH